MITKGISKITIKKTVEKILCTHENGIIPMTDITGWTIGTYCTYCKKTFMRKDIPGYQYRIALKRKEK